MSDTSAPRELAAGASDRCRAVIIRHPKERKSKCSVQPLVGDPRFHFVRFDPDARYDASRLILLSVNAPPLTPRDRPNPFLILDSTWRYLPAMRKSLVGEFEERSLSSVSTAYPRVSKLAEDPTEGLASIEALYAALRIVGQRDDALLSDYHWRSEFLESCARAGL